MYRISTITATGSLNTELNLDNLYDSFLEAIVRKDPFMDNVMYIEYGKKKMDMGHHKKFINRQQRILQNSESTITKRFDNQVTIVYKTTISTGLDNVRAVEL